MNIPVLGATSAGIFLLAVTVELLGAWWRHKQDPFYWFGYKEIFGRFLLFFVYFSSLLSANLLNQFDFLQFELWLYYTHISLLVLVFTRLVFRVTSIYTVFQYSRIVDLFQSIFVLIFKLNSTPIAQWLKENYTQLRIIRNSARFTWTFKSEVSKVESILSRLGYKMREAARYMSTKELEKKEICKNRFKQILENEKQRIYYSNIREELKSNLELVVDESWDVFEKKLTVVFQLSDTIQERRYALENEILFLKERILYNFKHQIFVLGESNGI